MSCGWTGDFNTNNFKNGFYTDDFDQEMLDFIKVNSNYYNTDMYPFEVEKGHDYLRFAKDRKFYVTDLRWGDFLTKQQFKEKIGMVDKTTFTKDDLVVGRHVVECRNGGRYVLLKEGLLFGLHDGDGFCRMGEYLEDLTSNVNYTHMDIIKVYTISCNNIRKLNNLTLVWKREEKSDAQLEMEECQKQIKLLQEQMDKLQEKL